MRIQNWLGKYSNLASRTRWVRNARRYLSRRAVQAAESISTLGKSGYAARRWGANRGWSASTQARAVMRRLDYYAAPTQTELLEDRTLLTGVLDFSMATFTVGEDSGTSMVVTVTRTGDTTGTASADVTFADASATGADYDPSTVSISFGVNDTSTTVAIPILGDTLIEGNETFTAMLTNPDAGNGTSIGGTQPNATITIDDADTATVTVDGGQTFGEDGGAQPVSVTLSTGGATLAASLNVTITATASAGTEGADGTFTGLGSFSFAAGSGNGATDNSRMFTPASDTLVEGNESVTLTPSGSTLDGQISYAANDGTIDDADTATVTVDGSQTLAEDGSAQSLDVTLTTGTGVTLENALTVSVATAAATGTEGADADFGSANITFAAGSGTTTNSDRMITPTNDMLVEGDEDVDVTPSGSSLDGQVTYSAGTATIEDDNTATVTVDASQMLAEDGSAQGIDVTLTTGGGATLENALTVQLDAAAGTGASGDTNADANTGTLGTFNFSAGDGNGTMASSVTLTPVDDALVEGDEEINIDASGDDLDGQVTYVDNAVTIEDDNTATVTVDASQVLNEDGTAQGIDVTLTTAGGATLENALSVQLDAAAGAGASGDTNSDATTGTLGMFSFAAGDGNGATDSSVQITPVDDTLVEGDEEIDIDASGDDLDGQVSYVDDSVTIEDDNTATVTVDASQSVTEDGGAQGVNVTLSTAGGATLENALMVTLTAAAATGTEAGDATFGVLGNFSFAAGDGNGDDDNTVTFTPTSDNVVETDEDATITPSGSSLDGQVTYAANDVTITNNDTASLSLNDPTVAEDGGTVTFTITSSNPTEDDVTVTVDTSNDSATAGSDYTAISGATATITGDSSTTTTTVVVTIANDQRVEGDEDFDLDLSSAQFDGATDATRATIGDATGTATITDNDTVEFAFTNATSDVDEDDVTRNVEVTATLTVDGTGDPGFDRTISVDVVDLGTGTADEGTDSNDDYEYPAADTLTFSSVDGNGTSFMKDAVLTIREDIVDDDAETINLQIQNLVDGSTTQASIDGANRDHTVTINDDDDATVTVDAPADGAADDFRAERDGADLVIFNGTTEVSRRPFAGVTTLTFDGADGEDDTFTVDLSTGDVIPDGGITFNGGTGGNDDLMIVGGTQGDVTYNYDNTTDGSVVIQNFGTVNYTGLEPISNDGDATNIVFNLPGAADATIGLTDVVAGTSAELSGATFEDTTFNIPAGGGSITINMGANNQTIAVGALTLNATTALTLNGDGGTDVVTFNNGPSNLSTLTVSSETINVNTASLTTAGDQTYTGNIAIGTDVELDGANVNVTGNISGASNLTLDGTTDVSGTIGTNIVNLTTQTGSLTAGTIDIDGDLDGDTAVSTDTGAITVDGNVDTESTLGSALGITVLGDSELGGNVTASSGSISLGDATADDVTLTANVSFTASAMVDISGGVDGNFNVSFAGSTGNDVEETIGTTIDNLSVTAGALSAGTIDIDGNLDGNTAVSTDTGAITIDGNVDTESTLGSALGITVLGDSELGGNVTATSGNVSLGNATADDVTLTANVSFTASAMVDISGGVNGNFNVSFAGSTGNDVEETIGTTINNLSVTAGALSAGTINIDGNLDGDTAVSTDTGAITIDGNVDTESTLGSALGITVLGDSELGGNVTATNGSISLGNATADDVTLTANVSLNASNTVGVSGGIDGDFNLEFVATNNSDVAETIGNTVTNVTVTTGTLTAGTIDIDGNLDADQNVTTDVGGILVDGNVDSEGTLTAATSVDVQGTSDLGGNVTASNGNASFDDVTTLTADVLVTTSANDGNIDFGANVLGDQLLTLAAGAGTVDFLSTVGVTTPLSGLTVNSAGTLNFDNTVAVDDEGIDITAATVTIDNSVTTANGGTTEITNSGTLTVAGAGDVSSDGTFTQNGTGAVSTAGDVTTTGDDLTFTTAVTLTGNVALSTGAGAGGVTLMSTVDGTTDFTEDLTITAGTGNVDFDGAIGSTTDLRDVQVVSGANVVADSSIEARSVDTNSTNLTFSGAVTVTGNNANGGADAVKVDASNTVTIDGAVTATANAGLNIDIDPINVNINANVTATGQIDITASNNVTIAAVTVRADTDGDGGTLNITADDDTSGAGTLSAADGSTLRGHTVNLSGDDITVDVVTADTGDATITAANEVTLNDTVTATTTQIVVTATADDVNINGTLDAGTNVDVGAGVNVLQAAGNNVLAGGNVDIDGPTAVTLNGTIGDTTAIGGSVDINQNPVALTSDVDINDSIDADGDIIVHGLTIDTAAGGTLSAGAGAGSGGAITIAGDVSVGGNITAQNSNVTLTGGNGTTADVVINANLTSDATLNVTAARDILVGTTATATISTTGTNSDITLTADSETTPDGVGGVQIAQMGALNSADAVTLSGSDLFANAGGVESVQIDSDGTTNQVTAAGNILIQDGADAPGTADTIVNGRVETTGATTTITVTGEEDVNFGSDGDLTTDGGTVTVTADTGTGNGAITMSDGAVINSDTGIIDIDAVGNITLGRLVTTNGTANAVNITTTMGGVIDGGDTGGEDIDADTSGATTTISAATGIGGAAGVGGAGDNAIETDIPTNSGLIASVTGTGDIDIDETDTIELVDVDTANGSIEVDAGSTITATDVESTTDADGNDIVLDAATNDILVTRVNIGGGATASNGDVILEAGDEIDETTVDTTVNIVADGLRLVTGTGDVAANVPGGSETTVNHINLLDVNVNELEASVGGGLYLVNTGALEIVDQDLTALTGRGNGNQTTAIAATGTVRINNITSGNISITELISAGGQLVTINASVGSILDGTSDDAGTPVNDIVSGTLALRTSAGGSVGAMADRLEVNTGTMAYDAGTGGIFVSDTAGGLTINNVDAITSSDSDGMTEITSAAAGLTVAHNVDSMGAIIMTAFDTAGTGDDFTLNNSIQITSDMRITLQAGDNLTLQDRSRVASGGGAGTTNNVVLNVETTVGSLPPGNADAPGSTVTLLGSIGTGTPDVTESEVNGGTDNDLVIVHPQDRIADMTDTMDAINHELILNLAGGNDQYRIHMNGLTSASPDNQDIRIEDSTGADDQATVYGTSGADNTINVRNLPNSEMGTEGGEIDNETTGERITYTGSTSTIVGVLERLEVNGGEFQGIVGALDPIDNPDVFNVQPSNDTRILIHGNTPQFGSHNDDFPQIATGDVLNLETFSNRFALIGKTIITQDAMMTNGATYEGIAFRNIESIPLDDPPAAPIGTETLRFDFDDDDDVDMAGTQPSPTQTGYTRVLANTFYGENGNTFGWVGSSAQQPVFDDDLGAAPFAALPDFADLRRDVHKNNAAATFRTDIADGWYLVSVKAGKSNDLRVIDATTGDVLSANQTFASGGTFTFVVLASGGQGLQLTFENAGTTGEQWRVAGLDIRPGNILTMGSPEPGPLEANGATVDFPGDVLAADLTLVTDIDNDRLGDPDIDLFRGFNATVGDIITIRAGLDINSDDIADFDLEVLDANGTTMLDIDPASDGIQVRAIDDGMGRGVWSYGIRRPSTVGTAFVSFETYDGTQTGCVSIDYVAPDVRRFDFNTATSPTQATVSSDTNTDPLTTPDPGADGYIGVLRTDRIADPEKGYGWDSSVGSFDSGDPGGAQADLLRDAHFSTDGEGTRTFSTQIANGTYVVNLTLGQSLGTTVNMEGVIFDGSGRNGIRVYTRTVTVNDGQFDLGLTRQASSSNWIIHGLELIPAAQQAGVTIDTIDIGGGPLAVPPTRMADADPAQTDTIAGTAAPNAVLSVASSAGTITSVDILPLVDGVQIAADASGDYSFTLQRPSGFAQPLFEVFSLDNSGFVSSNTIVTYNTPNAGGGRLFDFNTASATTQTGYINVQPTQVFDPQVGFGWASPIQSVDAGAIAGSSDSNLLRDSHGDGVANTFRVAIPDGTYEVTTTVDFAHNLRIRDVNGGGSVNVFARDGQVATGATHVTFNATATGGSGIQLEFTPQGSPSQWRVNGLAIRDTPNGTVTIAAPSSTETGAAATYALSGLVATSIYTVTLDAGTINDFGGSMDADPAYDGFQITGSTGGNLAVTNTASGGNATLTVTEVSGESDGTRTDLFTVPAGGQRFDFGNNNSPVEAGFTQVVRGDLFSAETGFGFTRIPTTFLRPGSNLQTDGIIAHPHTFRVGTGNGMFNVRVYSTSVGNEPGSVQVSLEGGAAQTIDTPLGMNSITVLAATANVTDGILDIDFASGLTFLNERGFVQGLDIVPMGTPFPLLATSIGTGADAVTQSEVDAIVDAALVRFEAAGLSEADLDQLRDVDVRVENIGGAFLGLAGGNAIIIDDDAAGNGWFVDQSPLDDSEFDVVDSDTQLTATSGAAAGRTDLLTTVMHELGHHLGLQDLDADLAADNLMTESLGNSTRRTAGDIDDLFSAQDILNELNEVH